ncbi:hypothetical protein HSUHS5_0413 [Helicobacter suis HS5]|uniref:Uncharacterized protein n=1 Tax=Helicobacter suis HS5 TaxID=710394 RepID=E7G3A1_9HELI|nr:hypothetical protein HSUHS5_0413 [Helicobacter suis HS5]EFX42948.1 hypothetical protein HSUHS1_0753 [Helicobacter suis HS1]
MVLRLITKIIRILCLLRVENNIFLIMLKPILLYLLNYNQINLGRIKMSFAPMLLATINNSIGNKDKHVSLEYLIGLFMDKKTTNLSNTDKYIIGTIQTEALEQEIEWFSQDYHIPMENILHVLSINPYQ